MDYRSWALLSALFAGVTAVLAKKGVENVPSNLALLVRVGFVLVICAAIAWATQQTRIGALSARNWFFLFLSAVATGASWLCYFRALQLGPVSRVAPVDKLSFVIAMVLGVIVLGEKVSWNVGLGAGIIVVGVLITLR
ncbi:MAG: EamA family transporter [Fimbriimonadales bacterium]